MKSNIDEIITFVGNYTKELNKGIDNGVKELTQLAYEIVCQYCIDENLSNHLENIKMDYDSATNTGTVATDDDVIVFKEMGTGIVGSNSPHPSPSGEFSSWVYDVNNHGEEGWKYPKKDGTYGWTKGLPAGSMFYKTFNDIKKYAPSTIQIEIHKTTGSIY